VDVTRLHLPAQGDFDHRSAAATLRDHAIAGLERRGLGAAAGQHRRLVDFGGEAHPVGLRPEAGGVTVQIDTRDEGVLAGLQLLVSSWFDLDTDIGPVVVRGPPGGGLRGRAAWPWRCLSSASSPGSAPGHCPMWRSGPSAARTYCPRRMPCRAAP
jgi:hypothetical protein